MSYEIVILTPGTYVKKSNKNYGFEDAINFVEILERKLSEWNFKCLSNFHSGIAHKLKYNQFEKDFLKKFNLIFYVVCSSSKDSFQSSIKKLVSSCHKKEKLNRVIILSLENEQFLELNESFIDVIYFLNYEWKAENDNQWQSLKDRLKTTFQNAKNSPVSESATLPISIPQTRHSSKIKTFLHNIPSKFDLKKDKSIKEKLSKDKDNEYIPDIKVWELREEFQDKTKLNDYECHKKANHSKLSLSLLFRKHPQKIRDSGLSMNSLESSCSDSKKSDTISMDKNRSLDVGFDGASETSPSSDISTGLGPSSLEKTKHHKSKIHNFKDKANKVLHNANCLHSPENKRKKHITDGLSNVALFSSFVITASSDMPVDNLKFDSELQKITSSLNEKCQSEPPFLEKESIMGSLKRDKIKYHSWNEEMTKFSESFTDVLVCKEPEIVEIVTETMNDQPHCKNKLNQKENIRPELISCFRIPNVFLEKNNNLLNTSQVENNNVEIKEYNICDLSIKYINEENICEIEEDNILEIKTKHEEKHEETKNNIIEIKEDNILDSEIEYNENKNNVLEVNEDNIIETEMEYDGNKNNVFEVKGSNILRTEMEYYGNKNNILEVKEDNILGTDMEYDGNKNICFEIKIDNIHNIMENKYDENRNNILEIKEDNIHKIKDDDILNTDIEDKLNGSPKNNIQIEEDYIIKGYQMDICGLKIEDKYEVSEFSIHNLAIEDTNAENDNKILDLEFEGKYDRNKNHFSEINKDNIIEENIKEINEDDIKEANKENNFKIKENDIDDSHENYFSVQYVTNIENNLVKTSKQSSRFPNYFFDSLKNISEDIQKDCNSKKTKSKINDDKYVRFKTFKVKDYNKESVEILEIVNEVDPVNQEYKTEEDLERVSMAGKIEENKSMEDYGYFSNNLKTPEVQLKMMTSIKKDYRCPPVPVRLESITGTSQPYLYRFTHSFFRNPIVVSSIFTITALTAPMWSSYIPHNMGFGQILDVTAGNIFRNEMVQALPNQLISSARLSTIAVKNSVRRFFIIVPNNDIFINSFKLIFS